MALHLYQRFFLGKSHCVHTDRQFEQYPYNIFQLNLVKFRLRGLSVPPYIFEDM